MDDHLICVYGSSRALKTRRAVVFRTAMWSRVAMLKSCQNKIAVIEMAEYQGDAQAIFKLFD